MHLYCVIQGRYKASQTAMANEAWQTGFRLVAAEAGLDPVGTLPADDTVFPVAASHNRNETDWTITGNWTLEMGLVDLDPADYLNDQIAPAVIDMWNRNVSSVPGFSSNGYVETIKLYPIQTNGKVAPAPPYTVGTPCLLTMKTDTVCDGAGAAQFLPPQVTLVASLRTAQVGSGGRGRMFLPGLSNAQYTGNGTADSTAVLQYATGVAQLLTDVSLGPQANVPWVRPIVAATTATPGGGRAYGPYAVIDTVRVGNIYDTQRRRRRSAIETVQSVAVPV